MSTIQIILIALILFFGSALQGSVGFGFALIAVPALIWVGVPLQDAVAVISASMMFQVVVAVYQLRREIVWPEIWRPLIIVYAFLPIGAGLLRLFSTLDPVTIKQVIGVILLIVVLIQIFGRVGVHDHLHFGWTILAFGASGLFTGLVAIGGPPIVLWVMAHRWTSQRARAFLMIQLLFGATLQMFLLIAAFGTEIIANYLLALAFSPIVAGASTLGVRLGNWLPYMRLRQAAFALVIGMALILIFPV